ncbi:uncharacterized protein PpBr36_10573 [Pyricularia pennisetigena]|uniref:uncharacterized protein n=1 Tax=Pyricularia pennisetigena TaxID=1578925 RepID=UPI001153B878|nr:uncharacterized protein PpBr36_10573 [Pyricularia pennisetigena]TLS21120.1 hypothetical protein PpBr36_10573 [Pyricularia pennisetigena]
MMRRPPGPVTHQQRKLLIAFAAILLPWLALVDAQQQQQQAAVPILDSHAIHGHKLDARTIDTDIHLGSPRRGEEKASRSDEGPRRRHEPPRQRGEEMAQRHPNAAATITRGIIETVKRKNTDINTRIPNKHDTLLIPDERALATVALDQLSVRAPEPFRDDLSSIKAGLATPHVARSLDDWEVEDFVIMATVDGDLYACDRHTGREIWHHKMDSPMVEVTLHRANVSVLDSDYSEIDHYLWIVEPTQDGQLYFYIPNRGLVPAALTIKQLVDEPFQGKNPDVYYAGDKNSAMLTLDVRTGKTVKYIGSRKNHIETKDSCIRRDNFMLSPDGDEECGNSGTITIARTEYTVSISNPEGLPIATIHYWEWKPNHYDMDLVSQYRSTMDNQYIATGANGVAYGFDHTRAPGNQQRFRHTFSSPVARVFDVLRPRGAPAGSSPDLKILPQPPMPFSDQADLDRRRSKVYLNRTETGGWYALGGVYYPLTEQSSEAIASKHRDAIEEDIWERMDDNILDKLLIGTHSLNPMPRDGRGNGNAGSTLQTLPGHQPDPVPDEQTASTSILPQFPRIPSGNTTEMIEKVRSLPLTVADLAGALFTNPLFIILGFFALLYKQDDMRKLYKEWKATKPGAESGRKSVEFPLASPKLEKKSADGTGVDVADMTKGDEKPASLIGSTTLADPAVPQSEADSVVTAGAVAPKAPELPTNPPISGSGDEQSARTADADKQDATSQAGPSVRFDINPESGSKTGETSTGESVDGAAANGTPSPEPEKKKKAHRGRRGGTKHRKKKREGSVSRDDDPPQASVSEIVDKAKQLGDAPRRIEPDLRTIIDNVQDLTGPIYKMGSLEVNEDQQLGTGSNGTVVFAGKWDGRDVAVKRMLIQFYDIASQETRLLRESDDHPNVIRYYAQQSRDAFLYIALELCQASLAEVIEKPAYFKNLAQAGEKDLPNVLYQITNGLSHLHSLRIVHRDLKPQNILVNMGKDGKPRLLVSDFGLCKKLEGGQSSFGATTAHAAGTTGWRAPELLLDDDARDNTATMVDASMSSAHSGSGSAQGSSDVPNRRATRAIDIFSLGLVFFYVLTKGSHPYDRGDRYMREVNIRKGSFDLSKLEVLGDYAMEARDIVERMLSFEPSERPTARDVMRHPFFWSAKKRLAFLCDVSDHFEKEPRDPPSLPLQILEEAAPDVITSGDFLRQLPREFVDSLGKQRKYTGSRMLDLLRALRNKKNHYEDMPESLKKVVGPLPEGYLSFWTRRFDTLLINCWRIVIDCGWDETDRFRDYYDLPAT